MTSTTILVILGMIVGPSIAAAISLLVAKTQVATAKAALAAQAESARRALAAQAELTARELAARVPVDTSTVTMNEANTFGLRLNTILKMSEYTQDQNTVLINSNNELREQVTVLQTEIVKLNTTIVEQGTAALQQSQVLQTTIDAQSAELSELKITINAQGETIIRITQDNAILQSKVDSLQSALDSMTKKNEEQNAQLTALLVKMAGPADVTQPTVESAGQAQQGNPENLGSSVEAAKGRTDGTNPPGPADHAVL